MTAKQLVVLVLLALCVGTVTAQTDWVPYEGNPVVPRPDADSWAGLLRWVEAVVVVDGTYHMFFTGTRTAFWMDHAIGHATSLDGISWTMDPGNPVMMPVTEGDWDVTSFASLAVIHDGDEFRMWYGGVDGADYCQIGLATSPDGSVWTRFSGNPVIENGPVGAIDAGLVLPGTVLVRGGVHHMWTSVVDVPVFTADNISIGYATSPDGVTWSKHPSPVLEKGTTADWDRSAVYGPGVIFDGVSYHMWYSGVVGAGIRYYMVEIGYATSPDGINWTKSPENPLEELGSWKAQPRVLLHAAKRECEMFFNGEYVDDFTVNRATSSCRKFSQFRRPAGRRIATPERRYRIRD